jgi:hypothetical protein
MRPHAETIRLGAEDWVVRPLTLRQVQDIEPILVASATDAKNNVRAAIEIVSIALLRDHSEAASRLADIEATASEIGAAMTQVLRLGGFIEGGGDPNFLDPAEANPTDPALPRVLTSGSSTQGS